MSLDLTTLRERVALLLQDQGLDTWSAEALDQHLRAALWRYTRAAPRIHTTTVTLDGRRFTPGFAYQEIIDLIYPYDPDEERYPPERPLWHYTDDEAIFLEVVDAPKPGDQALISYTQAHTIAGLDGADTTTLDDQGADLIVRYAAALAIWQYASVLSDSVNVQAKAPEHLMTWARETLLQVERELEELRRRHSLSADPRIIWSTRL